jgi:hypothetical protein
LVIDKTLFTVYKTPHNLRFKRSAAESSSKLLPFFSTINLSKLLEKDVYCWRRGREAMMLVWLVGLPKSVVRESKNSLDDCCWSSEGKQKSLSSVLLFLFLILFLSL